MVRNQPKDAGVHRYLDMMLWKHQNYGAGKLAMLSAVRKRQRGEAEPGTN